jgi:tetratricopeptide (TPR) repeat protein
MFDRLRFVHRLTADAAYGALLASNRRALHSAAADTLAARYVAGSPGDREALTELVEHLMHAGRSAEAFRRLCSLLLLSVETGFTAGWDGLAERAQLLWTELRTDDPTLPELATDFLRARAAFHRNQGRLDEAAADFDKMLRQSRTAQDRQMEAAALYGLGTVMQSRGRMSEVIELMLPALDAARAVHDDMRTGYVLNTLSIALHSLGRDEEALACLNEALALAEATGDRRRFGTVSGNLGVVYYNLGDSGRALDYYTTELDVAHELGDVRAESFALSHLGNLHRKEGRLAAARSCYERDLELCRLMGDRSNVGYAYGTLANLAQDEGDLPISLDLYGHAVAETRAGGDIRFTAQWLCHRGEVLVRLGRLDEAGANLAEALELATAAQDHWVLGSIHCRRAQLAMAHAQTAGCAAECAIWLANAQQELETALADAADYGEESDLLLDIRRLQAEVVALAAASPASADLQ